MRRIALLGILVVTWMLWSGHVDPLMLGLAGASLGLVMGLVVRLGLDDEEGVPSPILGLPTLPYLAWLCWQVVLSNLTVASRIWQGPRSLAPQVVTVQPSQRTAAGRVLYGNSITLTPGTVSVQQDDAGILVHALLDETAEDLRSGEMDRRVAALERGGEVA